MEYPPHLIRQFAQELAQQITGEVRFDEASRALYATDSSNYRMPPIGVVLPRTIEDVIQTVALCRSYQLPLLPRGGGTSLAGQCCNYAVILDFSKYLNQVLAIDPEKRLARVQPGCVLDDLRKAAEPYGLTFGPDPATHYNNTLGGMIGNDSCGVRSVLAAFEGEGPRTSDNIETLEILTYEGVRLSVGKTSEQELHTIIEGGGPRGEIYAKLKQIREQYAELIRQRFPNIPRRVSGYGIDQLLPENNFNVARALVGSEGTCAIVLEATVQLIKNPRHRVLLVLGYPDIYQAADHVPEILTHKPSGLEGMDSVLIEAMTRSRIHPQHIELLPPGKGWLITEFGADTPAEAEKKAQRLIEETRAKRSDLSFQLFQSAEEQQRIWLVREAGLSAFAHVPGEPLTWEGWEDAAVAPEKLGVYLRELHKLFRKYHWQVSIYGHFGQGCMHCRIPFDLTTAAGLTQYRAFMEEATDLVLSLGGSLSGEHGDGQAKAEFLEKMYGPELMRAFHQFKSTFDPQFKMNPGKVIDANRITEHLRLGTDYQPWQPDTHFSYPQDQGNFGNVALRCVGVGKCRRKEGGLMCPSYMVTQEEKYSTRGRARLLFEMLKGEIIGKHRWRESAVKEALDLCLACKGCRSECPMGVDMASYKAEFLSHYYQHRLRPRQAYAFGLISRWLRVMTKAPWLFNFLSQNFLFSSFSKKLVGMANERTIPAIAKETFTSWFKKRTASRKEGKKIILWPDTFTNYFHPHIGQAAVEVLEQLGYQVLIPDTTLCCGRPLYDYGFLKTAKKTLLTILTTLSNEIRAGIPLIGLEPSCVAVFRDELLNLLPKNEDARRLAGQTFTLSEYLTSDQKHYPWPQLQKRALIQIHCHHKAVMGFESEQSLLRQLGLDFEVMDAGCCGMAGSFGYAQGEHFELSIKAGERVLFPKIRQSPEQTLIIANGFSCQGQILHGTGRQALHLAEVLKMALTQSSNYHEKTSERLE